MRVYALLLVVAAVAVPRSAAAWSFTNSPNTVCLLNVDGVPSWCSSGGATTALGTDWTFYLLDGGDTLVVNSTAGCSCSCNSGGSLTAFSYPGGRVLTVVGGRDNDQMFGGVGSDTFYGDDVANVWTMGERAGSDSMYGGGGGDQVYGCHGYDQVWGGPGTDYLYGQDDEDCLDDGDDTWSACDCGPGWDDTEEAGCSNCEDDDPCVFAGCPSM